MLEEIFVFNEHTGRLLGGGSILASSPYFDVETITRKSLKEVMTAITEEQPLVLEIRG